jgi:hypothetical protein
MKTSILPRDVLFSSLANGRKLTDVTSRTSKLIGPGDAAHAIADLMCEVRRLGWILPDGRI